MFLVVPVVPTARKRERLKSRNEEEEEVEEEISKRERRAIYFGKRSGSCKRRTKKTRESRRERVLDRQNPVHYVDLHGRRRWKTRGRQQPRGSDGVSRFWIFRRYLRPRNRLLFDPHRGRLERSDPRTRFWGFLLFFNAHSPLDGGQTRRGEGGETERRGSTC